MLMFSGRALSACQMYNNVLIAGYVNGKTCLWNVESNWKHSLEPAPEVLQDPAKASVECVSVVGNVCATGFTCGECEDLCMVMLHKLCISLLIFKT